MTGIAQRTSYKSVVFGYRKTDIGKQGCQMNRRIYDIQDPYYFAAAVAFKDTTEQCQYHGTD